MGVHALRALRAPACSPARARASDAGHCIAELTQRALGLTVHALRSRWRRHAPSKRASAAKTLWLVEALRLCARALTPARVSRTLGLVHHTCRAVSRGQGRGKERRAGGRQRGAHWRARGRARCRGGRLKKNARPRLAHTPLPLTTQDSDTLLGWLRVSFVCCVVLCVFGENTGQNETCPLRFLRSHVSTNPPFSHPHHPLLPHRASSTATATARLPLPPRPPCPLSAARPLPSSFRLLRPPPRPPSSRPTRRPR